MSTSPKVDLLRLMYKAFLEIRFESLENGLKLSNDLSNLFHRVPLLLGDDAPDYEAIINELKSRAENNPALTGWINNNINTPLPEPIVEDN